MKTKLFILSSLLIFSIHSLIAQRPSRKENREINRLENQKAIASLIDQKAFLFVASRALPSNGASVDLTTNRGTVLFGENMIDCYLPFFGRAYSIEYGGPGGLKFKEKPKSFKIIARKEGKGYELNAEVTDTHDNFKLSMIIGPDGNSTLTVISNQRSTISYYGKIQKPEEKQ